MKKIRMIIFAITILPIVAVASIFAAPFYAMCIMAGEKETMEPMMDRVADWLCVKCKSFAEGGEQHVSQ